jgi:hypothetical protein
MHAWQFLVDAGEQLAARVTQRTAVLALRRGCYSRE